MRLAYALVQRRHRRKSTECDALPEEHTDARQTWRRLWHEQRAPWQQQLLCCCRRCNAMGRADLHALHSQQRDQGTLIIRSFRDTRVLCDHCICAEQCSKELQEVQEESPGCHAPCTGPAVAHAAAVAALPRCARGASAQARKLLAPPRTHLATNAEPPASIALQFAACNVKQLSLVNAMQSTWQRPLQHQAGLYTETRQATYGWKSPSPSGLHTPGCPAPAGFPVLRQPTASALRSPGPEPRLPV